MANQDQSNKEFQPPSLLGVARQIYELFTIPLQLPPDGPLPESSDENFFPSTTPTIFPGSYPSERRNIVRNTSSAESGSRRSQEPIELPALHVSEPDIASSPQASEERGNSNTQSEAPVLVTSPSGLSHNRQLEEVGIAPFALRVSEQVFTREDTEKQGILYDRSEGSVLSAAYHNSSHNKVSPSHIPALSDSMVTAAPAQFQGASREMPVSVLCVHEQAVGSVSRAVEGVAKHGTFCNQSQELATSPNISHMERSHSSIHLRPMITADASSGISPYSLQIPVQDVASVSQAREELAKHGAFCSQSERPGEMLSLSHIERSQTPISSNPMIATQFQGAYGFRFSGNPNLTNIGVNSGYVMHVNNYCGYHGLERLEKFVSFNALHDSYAQDPDRICHPGTRIVVLKRIRNWIGDPNSAERVFWLYGPAGAGKSAIAQTIARSSNLEQVAATFFFFKSDPSRSDGNRLFTTISWQLALLVPAIKDHIARSLDKRPDLPRKDVETQFEEFIVRPFQALQNASALLSSFVIIIDGVDECTDEKLQRRFLNLIGNAANNKCVPLRFLICSRPEAHIQETIDRFPKPNFQIDLASLDDANHDIEKYLREEFSRIASEQGLDSATWPGDQRIQQFVYKSSGNFIYASTVIRYADDEYNSAIRQLDIILGLKPYTSKSPFAELDTLYMEILERQPDRDFLIAFLALLVARLSIPYISDLHLDDAMLMNVSEIELYRKLRGMRSLFKFEPHIDLYHRSFLDFIQDPSRSCKYYMSEEHAQRRYLDLIIDSVVRFAKQTIEQPTYHEIAHFRPQFYRVLYLYPPRIQLPVTEWQQALQPLLRLQEELLILPNNTATWNLLPCNTCTVFQIMRDLLLHFTIIQGNLHLPVITSIQAIEELYSNDSNINEGSTNRLPNVAQDGQEADMDGCIHSLLRLAQLGKSESWMKSTRMKVMSSLLRFDYRDIAKKISSVADAQKLIDMIDSASARILAERGSNLINDKHFLDQNSPDTACKLEAGCLALEIYARVPVLPRSLFSDTSSPLGVDWYDHYQFNANLNILCQAALLGRIRDRNYIGSLLQLYDNGNKIHFITSIANTSNLSLREWRRTSNPSSVIILQVMLEVAKAIRYLNSIGVVFIPDVAPDDIILDSNLHEKIGYMCSTLQYIKEPEAPSTYLFHDQSHEEWNADRTNVHVFGCFFYEIYFDCEIENRYQSDVSKRPSEPEIHEDAWQLIQWCCTKDPKARPTMDQVVQEMESWDLA